MPAAAPPHVWCLPISLLSYLALTRGMDAAANKSSAAAAHDTALRKRRQTRDAYRYYATTHALAAHHRRVATLPRRARGNARAHVPSRCGLKRSVGSTSRAS